MIQLSERLFQLDIKKGRRLWEWERENYTLLQTLRPPFSFFGRRNRIWTILKNGERGSRLMIIISLPWRPVLACLSLLSFEKLYLFTGWIIAPALSFIPSKLGCVLRLPRSNHRGVGRSLEGNGGEETASWTNFWQVQIVIASKGPSWQGNYHSPTSTYAIWKCHFLSIRGRAL